MSIYVEILMPMDMDKLWHHTQTPHVHARWDLRFSSIDYLPRPDAAKPQQFLYSTRIGFGITISGNGETVGTREEATGARTSALAFWSEDPRSLIREGSGYWKYIPTPEGILFLTRYSYQTRFGQIGHWFDRLLFRPLLGWATAWSFDRLRLWLERDIDPAVSLERSVVHAVSRITLACIWIYEGVVPKLLFPGSGELALLNHLRLMPGYEPTILTVIGIAEILFGFAIIWRWRSRSLLLLNILIMIVLGIGALVTQPLVFVAPFNPFTLNLAMASLSIAGILTDHDLPYASSCRRKPRENQS